jgi:lysozyme
MGGDGPVNKHDLDVHALYTHASHALDVHALDVSEYQGRIEWRQVADAGYRHAAIKATEGTSHVDGRLKHNADHARDAGVHASLYHYAHPSESPRREARHFLDVAFDLVEIGDPAPVLDLEIAEGLSPHQLWQWQHAWGEIVGQAFGTTTILYTYSAFLFDSIWLPRRHRPIWGADYGHVPASTLAEWHAWQYSSVGTVPGVPGRVDLDLILKPLPTVTRRKP